MCVKVLFGCLMLAMLIGGIIILTDRYLARSGHQTICQRWGIAPWVPWLPLLLLLTVQGLAAINIIWGTWFRDR